MANPVNYLADNVKGYESLDEGLRVPEMLLLQKLNPLPPILLCLVATSYFGYVNMVWCFLGPMVNTRLTTLIFNVHFHPEDDHKVLFLFVLRAPINMHAARRKRCCGTAEVDGERLERS